MNDNHCDHCPYRNQAAARVNSARPGRSRHLITRTALAAAFTVVFGASVAGMVAALQSGTPTSTVAKSPLILAAAMPTMLALTRLAFSPRSRGRLMWLRPWRMWPMAAAAGFLTGTVGSLQTFGHPGWDLAANTVAGGLLGVYLTVGPIWDWVARRRRRGRTASAISHIQ